MTDASGDRSLSWNVAGLLADGVGASRTYDVHDVSIDLPEGLALAEPIEGQVRLSRTNRGILADGRAPLPGVIRQENGIADHQIGESTGRQTE